MSPRQFPGARDEDAVRPAKLGGVGDPARFKLLLELEGVRLGLDEPLALACALKDDFLDATAIPIGWRSPKPPCVGPG